MNMSERVFSLALVLVSLVGVALVHSAHERDKKPEAQKYDHCAEMRVVEFINGDRHWVDADDLTRVPAFLREAAIDK